MRIHDGAGLVVHAPGEAVDCEVTGLQVGGEISAAKVGEVQLFARAVRAAGAEDEADGGRGVVEPDEDGVEAGGHEAGEA